MKYITVSTKLFTACVMIPVAVAIILGVLLWNQVDDTHSLERELEIEQAHTDACIELFCGPTYTTNENSMKCGYTFFDDEEPRLCARCK